MEVKNEKPLPLDLSALFGYNSGDILFWLQQAIGHFISRTITGAGNGYNTT
jgi:hypothetical protein